MTFFSGRQGYRSRSWLIHIQNFITLKPVGCHPYDNHSIICKRAFASTGILWSPWNEKVIDISWILFWHILHSPSTTIELSITATCISTWPQCQNSWMQMGGRSNLTCGNVTGPHGSTRLWMSLYSEDQVSIRSEWNGDLFVPTFFGSTHYPAHGWTTNPYVYVENVMSNTTPHPRYITGTTVVIGDAHH